MAKLEMGEYTQVLFSEFSRLERKPTNLLRDLEKFQSLGVYAWFSKQNLWVRDDKDLGTQIMIHILAVMSQYEIELFAARGIDGKISSMKNRGAYNSGPCPYGYTISPGTGKLVVNPEEAEMVWTIFEKFSKGEKTAANQRRINKGIAPAKYKRVNKIFEERAFNRNQSIRHGNLLKTLLRCGDRIGNPLTHSGHHRSESPFFQARPCMGTHQQMALKGLHCGLTDAENRSNHSPTTPPVNEKIPVSRDSSPQCEERALSFIPNI